MNDIEEQLTSLHAPPPEVHPFVLVNERHRVVIQYLGNGMNYAATYRTEQGAKRGVKRWGGRIVDRRQ